VKAVRSGRFQGAVGRVVSSAPSQLNGARRTTELALLAGSQGRFNGLAGRRPVGLGGTVEDICEYAGPAAGVFGSFASAYAGDPDSEDYDSGWAGAGSAASTAAEVCERFQDTSPTASTGGDTGSSSSYLRRDPPPRRRRRERRRNGGDESKTSGRWLEGVDNSTVLAGVGAVGAVALLIYFLR